MKTFQEKKGINGLMRILVLNGSPRGESSSTLKISKSFVNGMKRAGDEVKILNLKDYNIAHCLGCFSCWTRTPGECVQKDDATWIFKDYLKADVVVWSSPLYSFGLTSIAKTLLDRLLPVYQPIIKEREQQEGAMHPYRFDLSYQKYVLVTGCGFYAYENNMEALVKQFEIMYGDALVKIICTEAELFQYKKLNFKTDVYLQAVTEAGKEFRAFGKLSEETENKLSQKHYVPNIYMELANLNWQISDGTMSKEEKLRLRIKNTLSQMKMIYDTSNMKGKCATIEFIFEDSNYECQMIADENECQMIEEKKMFQDYDLRIYTTLKRWNAIIDHGVLKEKSNENAVKTQSGFQTLIEWAFSIRKKGIKKEIKLL